MAAKVASKQNPKKAGKGKKKGVAGMKVVEEPTTFDVLAVNLKTYRVRVMDTNKTKANAEAISDMAAIRRGCDEEFYPVVPAGKYQEGDDYRKKTR